MDTKKDAAKKPVANTDDTTRDVPKPESSAEYEGAPNQKPSGNPPVAKKTETSSSSGE
jgi:hypothetical protein